MIKKTYVIGDIHGCINTLNKLLTLIPKNSNIYSVGDLIDKGNNPAKVVQTCIEKNIKVIKGNHEEIFIKEMNKYLDGKNIDNSKWIKYWGGEKTLSSYKNKDEIRKHLKFIKTFPLYEELNINNKDIIISHGFSLPYYNERNSIDKIKRAFLSNRLYGKHFDINNIENQKKLSEITVLNIFGHDTFKEVKQTSSYIGIDTGCVYGKTEKTKGHLTAICLEDFSIISVPLEDNIIYKNKKGKNV